MKINVKTIVLGALVLLALISIAYVFSVTKKGGGLGLETTPTTTPSEINKIVPGKSTEVEVFDALGKPKLVNGDVQTFDSLSPTRDNQIVYQEGVAQLIKEIVAYSEKRNTDEVALKYGTSQDMLYGPDSVNGYYLFVYPTEGVAYLGNPISKSLLEIWRFSSTDINTFINKWGQGYFTTPPKEGF
ncbi:MAG: hypothetical protein NT162_01015 [Candidatus Woesebacteria bacterium]|nr:hypothetical protein [Candidatus Woesebacteria bacterium]